MFTKAILALLSFLLLPWEEGGITFYYGEPFEGTPLACPGYRYEEQTGPWLAVDVSWYSSGKAQCGDWFVVEFYDGSTVLARALDAGHLASATVWDSGKPFVADLPRYGRQGRETATGRILNLSALLRQDITSSKTPYAK